MDFQFSTQETESSHTNCSDTKLMEGRDRTTPNPEPGCVKNSLTDLQTDNNGGSKKILGINNR